MREEEKIFAGMLFAPGHPELRAIKLRTHNLCTEYNLTFEDEIEKRQRLISEIFAEVGENSFYSGAYVYSLRQAYKNRRSLFLLTLI